jgi:hypothetical protein
MAEWIWLDTQVLRAVHEEQLAEHGGAAGVRDEGLFESAVMRPQQLAHYGAPDVADLAAAYGYGLARNLSSTATSARPSLPSNCSWSATAGPWRPTMPPAS